MAAKQALAQDLDTEEFDAIDEAIRVRRQKSEEDATLNPEEFYRDRRALAKHYIDQFFADKMFYCGGPIPKRFINCPKQIDMVADCDIVKGVEMAYRALENTISIEEMDEARRCGDSTSDVKLVNETLKILARAHIPMQYAGGMMIMYLSLVEGVEFEP